MILPQDTAGQFDIAETVVTIAASGITPVLGADPNRVGLIFATGGNIAYLSTATRPVAGQGIPIGTQVQNTSVFLSHKWFGPLIGQPWYGQSSGVANQLTVITVSLRRQPPQDLIPQGGDNEQVQ